jgi:hypothetical protein
MTITVNVLSIAGNFCQIKLSMLMTRVAKNTQRLDKTYSNGIHIIVPYITFDNVPPLAKHGAV